MLDAAPHLDEWKVQYRLILQIGIRNQDLVANLPDRPYVMTPTFIEDMASAYKAADLLVCRAGAGTLAEAALWQLPALVVPLPTSAGDHQRINATHYERAGGAQVLPQDELDGSRLARAVHRILKNPSLWREMAAGMRSQARPRAAAQVLDVIEQVTGGLS
jgi:UDP-N-acetylglucosamine--N-acetylmuramyl-(pentapeptide) pyrophosphoryl-undecaprenol N-acetylglucosamine transferase